MTEVAEKKRGRGRPKGAKDSKKRVRSPSLKTLRNEKDGLPRRAIDAWAKGFFDRGIPERLLEKWVEVAFDDNHKLQAHAWSELGKRGFPVSLFENKEGGDKKPVININVTGVSEFEVEGEVIDGNNP